MNEENLVTQEWLDAHPDSALKIGDVIPIDEMTAAVAGLGAELAADPAAVPAEPVIPERDYDQERDDRVIPVAQGFITDVVADAAGTNILENTDFTDLLMKTLQRALDADLNLTTDNPYIFQLVLSVYGAFSSVVQKAKVVEMPNARYAKIGQEMLTIMASANIPMGKKVTPQEQQVAADAIQPQLEEIFTRENLTWLEVKYIMEGLFRSLKGAESLYQRNVDMSLERMETKVIGVDAMSDITMKTLNKVLMTDASELKKKRDEIDAAA